MDVEGNVNRILRWKSLNFTHLNLTIVLMFVKRIEKVFHDSYPGSGTPKYRKRPDKLSVLDGAIELDLTTLIENKSSVKKATWSDFKNITSITFLKRKSKSGLL